MGQEGLRDEPPIGDAPVEDGQLDGVEAAQAALAEQELTRRAGLVAGDQETSADLQEPGALDEPPAPDSEPSPEDNGRRLVSKDFRPAIEQPVDMSNKPFVPRIAILGGRRRGIGNGAGSAEHKDGPLWGARANGMQLARTLGSLGTGIRSARNR